MPIKTSLARSLLDRVAPFNFLEFQMKKILVPSLLTLSLFAVTGVVYAQAAESTLSFNAGVVSDYRFRGISQSRLEPAVQAGVDYADKSGFYVGAWASSIKWVTDINGGSKAELNFYGGHKGSVAGMAYDVGFLRYEYPEYKLSPSANTNEVYGALTHGIFTAKYSHALTNAFGVADSKNSYYLDLSAAVDMGNGLTLTPHVGYQSFNNNASLSYTDYSLTVAKDLGKGLTATAAIVATDADKALWVTPNGKFTGRTGAVVGLKYSF